MSENTERIEKWAKQMEKDSTVVMSPTKPQQGNMTVPKETLLGCFDEAGVNAEAVSNFGKAAGDVVRAMHFAATNENIKRVKAAVKNGEDFRNITTVATGKIGRDLIFSATSQAERTGTVAQPNRNGEGAGTPRPYRKFNYGRGTMDIGAGMPSELKDRQADEMRAAVKDSKFYTPLANEE